MKQPNRPDWDTYFLNLAQVVKTRSNCLRMSVGAVIVREKRIIASGYNGTPAGIKNCCDGGCKRCSDREHNIIQANERKDLCICIHAEQNAILQSSHHGTKSKGATLYSTVAPCLQCAKAIINAGVVSVVYLEDYKDHLGIELLQEAGIACRFLKKKNIF